MTASPVAAVGLPHFVTHQGSPILGADAPLVIGELADAPAPIDIDIDIDVSAEPSSFIAPGRHCRRCDVQLSLWTRLEFLHRAPAPRRPARVIDP